MAKDPMIDQILARRRERMKDPLSPDEIFTLHGAAGGELELSENERERLLERLGDDPQAAHQLLELMRFPYADEPTDASSRDQGISQRWAELRERLIATGELRQKVRTKPDAAQRLWPLAASFLMGAVLALLAGSLRAPQPAAPAPSINLPIIELADAGAGNRNAVPVRVPATADGMIVTLTSTIPRGLPPFQLSIQDPTGKHVLEVPGLEPGPGGVFVLTLPRAVIRGGSYQLELRDRDGNHVSTFLLEIADDHDPGG